MLNEWAYKILGLVYTKTLYNFDCTDAVKLLQILTVDSLLYICH